MHGDINCMTRKIFNIGPNSNRDQVINRAFVEDFYLRRDGYFSMSGNLNMNNKKRINVDEGIYNQDAVNKHQLDVGLQTKPNSADVLLLNGRNLAGDLDLRGNKIILPGEINMDQKLITNLDTDEN